MIKTKVSEILFCYLFQCMSSQLCKGASFRCHPGVLAKSVSGPSVILTEKVRTESGTVSSCHVIWGVKENI